VDMERALEPASWLRHHIGDVELRSDGPDVKGEVENKRRLASEHWVGWQRRN